MSGDEIAVTLASLVLGPLAWIWWFVRAAQIAGFRAGSRTWLNKLAAVILVCAVLIERTLRWGAADDVRNAPQYVFMYFVMGWAWLRLAAWAFPFLGLSPRDDLLERRNRAALPAFTGAMLGATCCYAGGNIGNGPGWWVVVFSGALASAALVFTWITFARASGVMDAVTIDRDPAAGWRLGGLLAAAGLIFGAAVTGDWVSAPATVRDFVPRIWGVIPIVFVAVAIERAMRPTAERPRAPVVAGGVAPAVLYVAIAGVSAWWSWSAQ